MATNRYELWDLEAGNLIGSYHDEAAALAQVREGVDADGAELWREVGMLRIGEQPEDATRVAIGDELLALARVEYVAAR